MEDKKEITITLPPLMESGKIFIIQNLTVQPLIIIPANSEHLILIE